MGIADFLPYSVEIEQATLSSFLNPENKLYNEILKLDGEDFYEPVNRDIFSCLKKLVNQGLILSYEQIFNSFRENRLDKNHPKFEDYLKKIIAIPVNLDSLKNNLDKLRNLRMRREYYQHLEDQRNSIFDMDITNEQLFSESENFMTQTILKSFSDDIKKGSELSSIGLENIMYRKSNPSMTTGIPTYYEELDRLTKGFSLEDITVVGGRPSMGKTRLMLNVFLNTAIKAKIPTMYFSLEMSKVQIYMCCMAILSGVSLSKIQTGFISDTEMEMISQSNRTFIGSNLFVSDARSMSISKMRAQMRKMSRQHGVQLFFVDYLQLLSEISRADNKVGITGDIVRQLRQSAQDIKCHVIIGSQLSRGLEQRADKHPKMSDLRESGNIEEYADRIWLLYRDDYYTREYSQKPGILEIIVDKQRTDGETGIVELDFERSSGRIKERTINTMIGFGNV